MNPPILNRNFQHPADGWYQIEAKGEHPNRAAGIVQVIDDEATQSIVNRFNDDAAAGKLRHGNEMLIDHEHFSDQPDQETRAYGWLQQLQNRADGIYGQIRWTRTGQDAVDGGDYRFFSTEYEPSDLQPVKSEIGNRKSEIQKARPLRLAGLTLTNMNNNRGQKPITNRRYDKTFAGSGESADTTETNQQPKGKMKTVCSLLGLSAEADEASVHAAVSKLLNRGDITVADLTTLKNRSTELETENQTLLGEQVDALLDAHGVKEEKLRNRLKPVIGGYKNREERVAALIEFGYKPVEAKADKPNQSRTLNRGTGKTEEAASAAESEEDDQGIAEKITNRAQELKGAAPARSFDSCWNQAKRELAQKK
jgi:Mu-like prophage I protein